MQVSPRSIEPVDICTNPSNSSVGLNQQNCQSDNTHEIFSTNSQTDHLDASQVHEQFREVFHPDEPPSYQELLHQPVMTETIEPNLLPPNYEDAIGVKTN